MVERKIAACCHSANPFSKNHQQVSPSSVTVCNHKLHLTSSDLNSVIILWEINSTIFPGQKAKLVVTKINIDALVGHTKYLVSENCQNKKIVK